MSFKQNILDRTSFLQFWSVVNFLYFLSAVNCKRGGMHVPRVNKFNSSLVLLDRLGVYFPPPQRVLQMVYCLLLPVVLDLLRFNFAEEFPVCHKDLIFGMATAHVGAKGTPNKYKMRMGLLSHMNGVLDRGGKAYSQQI